MRRFVTLTLYATLCLGQVDQQASPATGDAGSGGRSGGPGAGWGSQRQYRFIYGERVYHVGGDVSAPRLLSSKVGRSQSENTSEYTSKAVVIWAIISRKGFVRHPKVVRSLSPSLDETALRAVTGWRFAPALRSGKPVPVEYNLTYRFSNDEQ